MEIKLKREINNIFDVKDMITQTEEELNPDDKFLGTLFNLSKIFRLDSKLAILLYNTDSKLDFKHLPFPQIIIDTSFDVNDQWTCKGIWIMDCADKKTVKDFYDNEMYNKKDMVKLHKSGGMPNLVEDITISCMLKNKLTGSVEITNFSLYDNFKDEHKLKNIEGINQKKIRMFIMSFLDFLHNPDIEIMKKEYSQKQITRKIKKGKYHLDHHYIKLNGKTKCYVDKLDELSFTRDYLRRTHSWIVRGYYMKLMHKRYKIKREVWIAPFIKGLGNLSDKKYLVTKEKRVWVNQTEMENIIKELYPKHLVLSNTRSFLDGLEIDCYIPDLKLGFEYNGEQHYHFPNAFHKTEEDFKSQQERDIEKNKLAKELGIKLITIKYDEELSEELILNKTQMLIIHRG